MIEFPEVMEHVNNHASRAILLGNGFSRAWSNDIFDYANLLDAATFGERDQDLRTLFQLFETYDFEKVMTGLVAAQRVLTAYDYLGEPLQRVVQDQETLKQALVEAISRTHPDLPSQVSDDEFTQVRGFLSQFTTVFTVNYDLLLYWARNKDNLPPAGYETDDGFRKEQSWKRAGTQQSVHFLHGGLHIYDSGSCVRKHAYTEDGKSILDQVRDNLEEGRFPVFVSEPTADAKKRRIERHPYLDACYQALAKLEGSIVIYGHSMDENDQHIFDQISQSRVDTVYVSIFGNEQSPANRRAVANARTHLEGINRTVEFFSAESTPIWA